MSVTRQEPGPPPAPTAPTAPSTTTKPGTVGARRLGPRGKRKPGELPKRQRARLPSSPAPQNYVDQPPPARTEPSTTTKPGTVGARRLGPRANASPASCPKGNEHGWQFSAPQNYVDQPPPARTAPSTTTKPGTVGARGLGPRANASPANCPKGNEHGYPHPRTTSTNRHQPGQNRAQQRNPAP